jgi:hypothetical protein
MCHILPDGSVDNALGELPTLLDEQLIILECLHVIGCAQQEHLPGEERGINLSGLQLTARWLKPGSPLIPDGDWDNLVDLEQAEESEGARGLPGFTTAVYNGSSPLLFNRL